MYRYILKRIVQMIPILLGVLIVVFTINYCSPDDPALAILGASATEERIAEVHEELGLDQPYLVQLGDYIKGVVTRFDLGDSYIFKRPVWDMIAERLSVTIRMGLLAISFAIVLGILLGVLSAIKQYSILDYASTTLALAGSSMPSFWLGLMLMIVFSLKLRLVPASGISGWQSWILPAIAIGVAPVATIMRTTRSSMLETIRQDYIRTVRAKGMPEKVVIWAHALKNALIPVITVIGFQLGHVLGGVIVVEAVFSIPGLGMLMQTAIVNKDRPVIQGCVLFCALVTCFSTLLVDVIYALINPQIKSQYIKSHKKRKAEGAKA